MSERFNILAGSSDGSYFSISRRRMVNWYPSKNPDANDISLKPFPGYNTFATVATNSFRGSVEFGGIGYAVMGTVLRKILASGTVSSAGTGISGSAERVDIAIGKTQIMIVDGSAGYTYTPSTDTFATISDVNFPANPTTCAHVDGYFLVNDPANPGRWYRSVQNDATNWTVAGAGSFATAEKKGDALKRIVIGGGKPIMIGENSTEFWDNTGDPDVIFTRIPATNSNWGIAAPFSAVEVDNVVIWLGKRETGKGITVVAANTGNFTISPISPDWLSEKINRYSRVDDAFAFTMDWDGHTFYVLTFPAADATHVFDITTGQWVEWADNILGRHRANGLLKIQDKMLIGDYNNGKIYQLTTSTYDNNGEPILRRFITENLNFKNMNIRYNAIEPVTDAGQGVTLSTDDGFDPEFQLFWSRDRGNTWHGPSVRKTGKKGEYWARTIFRNKGWARSMTLEFRYTEPVPAPLAEIWVDVTPSSRGTSIRSAGGKP